MSRIQTLILVLLTGLGACSTPRFEGPQIQEPPAGFLYDANAYQGRNVFPEREELRQGAWLSRIADDDLHSSIFITVYAGPSSHGDIVAARNRQEERYGANTRYAALEGLTIDERQAWAWLETQMYRGDVASLEYKAVVPYDTMTCVIEFFTRDPAWRDEAKLRQVVTSFAVGKREVNTPAVVVAAVAGLLGVAVLRRARRAPA